MRRTLDKNSPLQPNSGTYLRPPRLLNSYSLHPTKNPIKTRSCSLRRDEGGRCTRRHGAQSREGHRVIWGVDTVAAAGRTTSTRTSSSWRCVTMQRRRLELKAMRRVCTRESIWGELAFFYSLVKEEMREDRQAEEEGKKRPITWEINRRQHLLLERRAKRRLSLSRLRWGLHIAWIYGFTFESLLGMQALRRRDSPLGTPRFDRHPKSLAFFLRDFDAALVLSSLHLGFSSCPAPGSL